MSPPIETLVLSQDYIAANAAPIDYIRAVEAAFRALAAGESTALPVGHVPAAGGAFHIKAAHNLGALEPSRRLSVIKINGNFPDNPRRHGLPTIQGCIMLSDGSDGRLLALMDSIEITAQRTAAASAVAARHLAQRDTNTIALLGCGTQARYHLDTLLALDQFPLRGLRCFDLDRRCAERLAALGAQRGLETSVASSVAEACHGAQIVVSSTTSRSPFLDVSDIETGTFIAAVGADNPEKSEITAALMARARVVTDITAQAAAMGDLRGAIAAAAMAVTDVHAELAQIVAATRPGRSHDDEIFIFDSTGTAITDLAAAAMIYERARLHPGAIRLVFNSALR